MNSRFRVGLTPDFLKPDGTIGFGDIGLQMLEDDPHVEWEYLPGSLAEIPHRLADQYDALLVLAPRVTRQTLEGCRRLALVARFGVGYDNVDVPACTSNDVVLSITPDGVRRPVAAAALAFLLAVSHKLLIKDRLTRSGRWTERLDHMGTGLTGRTLGLIGLGNIGREILHLARPFQMRYVAFDPYANEETAAASGAALLDLDQLLAESDFVCVCCALTDSTRHLLNAQRLGRMKPTSYLINVARGPIIDQRALTDVLRERQIAGAALDVFETEPVDPRDPLLSLDNVIVAPHAICWTDELALGNGRGACQSILDVSRGRTPQHVVNREVLDRPGLKQKLARFAEKAAS